MPEWWWSWILTAAGIAGLYFAGSGKRLGWAIGLGAQVLWVAYAVGSQQWGFLLSAVAYGSVYTRNWIRWSKDQSLRQRCRRTVFETELGQE